MQNVNPSMDQKNKSFGYELYFCTDVNPIFLVINCENSFLQTVLLNSDILISFNKIDLKTNFLKFSLKSLV